MSSKTLTDDLMDFGKSFGKVLEHLKNFLVSMLLAIHQ